MWLSFACTGAIAHAGIERLDVHGRYPWDLIPLSGSIKGMAREKATVTLDRQKVNAAKALIRARSISETLDVALDRLIRDEQLRRDIAAYTGKPLGPDELAVTDLPVELDLDDSDVDYDALYGARR
jgi:hypothetical protein